MCRKIVDSIGGRFVSFQKFRTTFRYIKESAKEWKIQSRNRSIYLQWAGGVIPRTLAVSKRRLGRVRESGHSQAGYHLPGAVGLVKEISIS